MTTTTTTLDPAFVKSFRDFRASAKTFSGRAVSVVKLALNRALDNKSFAEWTYLQDQLAAKAAKGAPTPKDLLPATAKAALRKAIRIGLALVAGEAIEGKERPTFRIAEETLTADLPEIVEGRLSYWRSRRNAFVNLDGIAVQIEKEAPSTETLLKRFANAAAGCLASGLTLQDLIEVLQDAAQEAPKAAA